MANDYRHHQDVKDIYKQRPQHIERVFADGKTKYGLTKTYFRSREKVHRELTLLYACMNLKKFAIHQYAWSRYIGNISQNWYKKVRNI